MPRITRRDFLKIGAAGASTAVLAGCQNPRRWVTLEPFVRPPEEQLAGQATWYASTCRQCPAGCGIVVRTMNGRALKLEGNPEHPLNQGKLCARGQAGLQVLYNPDRLAGPAKQSQRGSRAFEAITWEEGLNTLLTGVQAAGSGLVVWLGSTLSGHVFDLFGRFTAAIGAEAPLVFDLYTGLNGYAPLAEARSGLIGQSGLPGYPLQDADVIFSFGTDFLGTWLSSTRYGAEYGAFRSQSLGKRGYLVQFEPRMSTTGAKADRWLPLRPGMEASVAQALLRVMADLREGPADRQARARALAPAVDVGAIAAASDVSVDELTRLARMFLVAGRPVALPGAALSGQGTAEEAIAAVEALNLIVGNPGAATTTPEGVSARPKTARFAEVSDLLARMRAGLVKGLLVVGANPAYELPVAAGFAEAVSHVPFIASFAPLVDETAVLADLVLPDRTYLESWGYEVVSPDFGEQVVGAQQPVVTPLLDTRAIGDVILSVARGLPAAAKALPWSDEVAFLKETIAALPAGQAGGSDADVQWARFLQHGGWRPAQAASAPSGAPSLRPMQVATTHYQGEAQEYPFFLHLYLSELLSDGRGASQPWLQGSPEANTSIAWQTWVEINPATAQQMGVAQGDIVEVTSPYGSLEAPVYLYPGIRPDTVAIPFGQGHTDYGRYARDRGSNPIHLAPGAPGASGDLVWSTLRVRVTRTGRRQHVATFEYSLGVTEGFLNKAFPGQ